MLHYVLISLVALVVLFVVLLVVRKKKMRGGVSAYPENKQLYVGNLSYQVNAHHLRQFFSQYGELQNVRLIKNTRTGRSKGFAFITFATIADAKQAVKANGLDLRGRSLVVRMAKPRDAE